MVSRWGALYNITKVLNNRYSGTVFVRMRATGHLFNQHYLSVIFPLPSTKPDPKTNGSGINGLKSLDDIADSFLDSIVNVDENLALKREGTAVGILRRGSAPFGSGDGKTMQVANGKLLNGTKAGVGGIEFLENGVATEGSGRGARGRSVRELSRLWRYLGGGSPKD